MGKTKKPMSAIALLILGLLFWAIEAVARKPIITDISPWLTTFITSFGIFIVSLFVTWNKRNVFKQSAKDHATLLFWAVILGILGFMSFFMALGKLDASVAGFVKMIEPVIVMLLGFTLLKEKMNPKKIPFAILAFVGLFMVNMSQVGGQNVVDWGGLTWLLIAGTAWASVMIIAKKTMNNGIDPGVYTMLRFAGQTLVLLPLMFFADFNWINDVATNPLLVVMATTLLTAIAFLLYYKGLQGIQAMDVAFIEFLSPLFMLILSFIFLGERFSLVQWLGGLVIFISLYFLLRKHR